MVVTRSQSYRTNSIEFETMSDSESDHSVPEVLSRDKMIEFDNGDVLNRDKNFDRNWI